MQFNFNKSFGSSNSGYSDDTFTEVTNTSYGQNIGNSFKGIFVGIMLLIGSIWLLWWNEGRSVEQANALIEMQENITTLPNTSYSAVHEGKAVLVQGVVKPLNEVVDSEFGVKSSGLVLRKRVEMYQWEEEKESKSQDKLGGGTETVTTYTYVKKWSSMQNSSSFFKRQQGHQNPQMMHKSNTFTTDAQLGDFHLSRSVVSHIGASEPYSGLSTMPDTIGLAKNYKSFLYIGRDPSYPQIGDYKITYTYAPVGEYTIAAKESSKSLMPYTTTNGKDLLFVRSGKVSAKSIFKDELEANALMTWILRGVGLLMMFIAFKMVMGPLETFAKVVPMFGSLVGGASSIVAMVLTLLLGSIVISLAWFSSRPMLSLIIIVIGVGVAFMFGKFGKKKETMTHKNTPAPSSPPKRDESMETNSSTPPSRTESTPPSREG